MGGNRKVAGGRPAKETVKLRRESKGTRLHTVRTIGSDSQTSPKSATDPELQQEGVPLEPPAESRTESNRNETAVGNEPSTTVPRNPTHDFWHRAMAAIVKTLPPAKIVAEDEGRDGLKEALRSIQAKQILEKLVTEEDEQELKTLRKGGTRRRGVERTYSPIPTLAHLRSLKSISQQEAADYLRCTERTIRNYAKDKKLKLTPKSRVVCDDKLVRLLRKCHGDGVLS
jgi:hypothetical protein